MSELIKMKRSLYFERGEIKSWTNQKERNLRSRKENFLNERLSKYNYGRYHYRDRDE